MHKLLGIVLLFLVHYAGAQGPSDWWYFGDKAGIHFTSSGPIANTQSDMQTAEGCASIADDFGNLLFYTRGDTVWDASHTVMLNGTGLLGNGPTGLSSMNAFIVPRPDHPQEYYIFTVRSSFGGLWYSKVNMALNNGMGAVVSTEKNIPLVDSTTEMVAAVRKPNNRDFWVIAMRKPGDTAYAYEVTPAGINSVPVKSNTGLNLMDIDDEGYLRASQQNDKLAMTLTKLVAGQINAEGVHLFDVDNVSGEVSFNLTITPSIADTSNYGIEFSPNGQFLYVQSKFNADCRQYDISSGVASIINNSEVLVGLSYTAAGGGALQLGPNDKLYVSRNADLLVGEIQFPNNAGVLCAYDHDALNLGGQEAGYGFPQFPTLITEGIVRVDDVCFGDTVFFSSNYLNPDSVFWNFGDPNAGIQNTSSALNPGHLFSDTGTFIVTHVAYDALLSDTTTFTVRIQARQTLNFPSDTLLCSGLPVIFDLEQEGALHYLWNGDTGNAAFQVQDTGLIELGIVGICDTLNQSVLINVFDPSGLELGSDTTLCGEASVTIGDASINAQYNTFWNTGETQAQITVDTSGTYVLTALNTCDTLMDSISISFTIPPSDSLLPPDTTYCIDTLLAIPRPSDDRFTYAWNDGTSAQSVSVSTDTLLFLSASNPCGSAVDSMRIAFNGAIQTDLGADTIICDEDSILLQGIDSNASYVWNNGSTADSLWTVKGETQRYRVTVTKGQCQKVAVIQVTSDFIACPNINCSLEYTNVFTPNGDGINDRFVAWSDCDIFRFDLYIYNRWGQMVHYSDNISFGWDGYVNGELAASGTYYFVIEYKDLVVVDADRQITRGSFIIAY